MFDMFDKSTYLTNVKRQIIPSKFDKQIPRQEDLIQKGGNPNYQLTGRTQ